ncbi:MAG: hypothetical protein LW688_07180 [Cryomorphaceae bacterium]|jgi:hypothetical protein|nr:hypothetical protein [Cryomorphaceae bacterium]
MKTVRFLPFLIALTVLASCGEKSTAEEKVTIPKNSNALEDKMAAIENNPSWKQFNSLAYNNNAGSKEEVIAYLNDKEEAVKLEERFTEVETGTYGIRFFYFSGGKKFASREVIFDNSLKKPAFVERLTFYDKKEQALYMRERSAEFEQDLENQSFAVKPPIEISVDRAMQVINQEGPFVTTFQGFAQGGGLTYVLVGENTPDGFASSLAIQYESEDIKKLRMNELGMIGTPLHVEHQTMMNDQGLKFQALLSLRINS